MLERFDHVLGVVSTRCQPEYGYRCTSQFTPLNIFLVMENASDLSRLQLCGPVYL